MATYDPEQILSIAREIQDLMTEKAFAMACSPSSLISQTGTSLTTSDS